MTAPAVPELTFDEAREELLSWYRDEGISDPVSLASSARYWVSDQLARNLDAWLDNDDPYLPDELIRRMLVELVPEVPRS